MKNATLKDETIKGNNSLSILFEHTNIFIDPYSETLIINGISKEFREYLTGYESESSIDQLLRCIETGEEPESNVKIGAIGVEVLMAAYRSISDDGRIVSLPSTEQQNPLFCA